LKSHYLILLGTLLTMTFVEIGMRNKCNKSHFYLDKDDCMLQTMRKEGRKKEIKVEKSWLFLYCPI